MLADHNHARRPALPGTRRRIVAALLCAFLLLWPALATANPATAATAAAVGPAVAATIDDTVALHVTPSNSSALRLNEDLELSVTITNDSASAVSAGNVDVYLAERALTSSTALDSWLTPDEDDAAGDLMTSVPLTAPVQPHSTVTIAITVPSAALGLFEWSPWGPRGIAASLSSDGSVRASGQSTFVWYPDASVVQPPVVTPVNLAVAMPITTPRTAPASSAPRTLSLTRPIPESSPVSWTGWSTGR